MTLSKPENFDAQVASGSTFSLELPKASWVNFTHKRLSNKYSKKTSEEGEKVLAVESEQYYSTNAVICKK